MKRAIVLLQLGMCATHAFAADVSAQPQMSTPEKDIHRYLVERTFPSGALEGIDTAAKAKVNANNASVGVHWIQSYANADMTKTYCVYEGPSEGAIRMAAALNHLPVDSITEVPVDLDSTSPANSPKQLTHTIVK